MEKREIIKLLKSGDFSIIYWDNQSPSLYKGKGYDVDNYPEDLEEIDFPFIEDGYLPAIVSLLTEALGGEADSI